VEKKIKIVIYVPENEIKEVEKFFGEKGFTFTKSEDVPFLPDNRADRWRITQND
jgi:hypothetical protein